MEKLKQSIYEKFVIGKQPPIYQPNEFIEFCRQAGPPNIFEHILQAKDDEQDTHRMNELMNGLIKSNPHSEFVNNILEYISGFVVAKLMKNEMSLLYCQPYWIITKPI